MSARSSSTRGQRIRWSLWAPFYDLVAPVLEPKRRRSLEVLGAKEGERILLLGCGTGLDLPWLPAGARVTALDATSSMLSRCRRRTRSLGLETRIVQGDARHLPFPDASFDSVVLHFILAVTPDPEECAREAARVLVPNGRAVVLDKFAKDGVKPNLALRVANPFARWFATNISRRLEDILRGSGLSVARELPAGLRGFVKIALLGKGGEDVRGG